MGYCILVAEPRGYQHHKAFFEVAEWLQSALRRLGNEVLIGTQPEPTYRNIVFGAHLLTLHDAAALPFDSVLFNLEQMYQRSPWLTPTLCALYRRFEVWDYSAQNAKAYPACGLPRPRIVPIGWAPELERIVDDGPDIDVLFYGSMNERRARVLDDLRARGLQVMSLFGCYGKERDGYIACSKLVLNIHAHESQIFEIVRVAYLLNNRRCVVCERGLDAYAEQEFAAGVAFADYAGLGDLCARLCSDEEHREHIAATGYEILRLRGLARLYDALCTPDHSRKDCVHAG